MGGASQRRSAYAGTAVEQTAVSGSGCGRRGRALGGISAWPAAVDGRFAATAGSDPRRAVHARLAGIGRCEMKTLFASVAMTLVFAAAARAQTDGGDRLAIKIGR